MAILRFNDLLSPHITLFSVNTCLKRWVIWLSFERRILGLLMLSQSKLSSIRIAHFFASLESTMLKLQNAGFRLSIPCIFVDIEAFLLLAEFRQGYPLGQIFRRSLRPKFRCRKRLRG